MEYLKDNAIKLEWSKNLAHCESRQYSHLSRLFLTHPPSSSLGLDNLLSNSQRGCSLAVHTFRGRRSLEASCCALPHQCSTLSWGALEPSCLWDISIPEWRLFSSALKCTARASELFSAGNHMVASWGYGKVGKGGRHLIPSKWANKISYHTSLKGRREFRILLSTGLWQHSMCTRVSCLVKQMSSCKTFY